MKGGNASANSEMMRHKQGVRCKVLTERCWITALDSKDERQGNHCLLTTGQLAHELRLIATSEGDLRGQSEGEGERGRG